MDTWEIRNENNDNKNLRVAACKFSCCFVLFFFKVILYYKNIENEIEINSLKFLDFSISSSYFKEVAKQLNIGVHI